MFRRNGLQTIKKRLQTVPALLLLGPRQCGKTTLVKQLADELGMGYISCDNIAALAAIEFDPIGFLRDQPKPLIIDEAQRAPELFLPIKVDIDAHRNPGRYLLTGSANPLLVPHVGDALTGRLGFCNLWPLSQGELLSIHDVLIDRFFEEMLFERDYPSLSQSELIHTLFLGGFPALHTLASTDARRQWCQDYLLSTLQKDINDLSKIEHFSQMPALLYGLANRVGSPLNMSGLTALIRTSDATIRRYIELLKSLFLLRALPAWSRNGDKRLAKAPKIYFSDSALLLYALDFDESRLVKHPNLLGHVFENFVVMELIKQATWSRHPIKFYHYRTRDKKEVDLVLETPSGKVVGIEIKLADLVRQDDLIGMRSLQEDVGSDFHRGIIFYTGDKTLPFGKHISAVPITALWSQCNPSS
jgi:uncharacterized protein